jgi:hypothetical protein
VLRSVHVRLAVVVMAAVVLPMTLAPARAATAVEVGHTRTVAGETDYGPVKAELSRYIRSLMAENGTAGLAIALVDGQRVFGLGGPLPAVGKGDPVTALGGDAFTYLGVRYRRVGS